MYITAFILFGIHFILRWYESALRERYGGITKSVEWLNVVNLFILFWAIIETLSAYQWAHV